MMISKNLAIFLIFGALCQFVVAQDYCNVRDCSPRTHTMCKYRHPGHSQQCRDFRGSGLSQAEKNEIVRLHNEMRRKVANGHERRGAPGPQPAARHMPNLVWDNELERIAQRWANQCQFGHDQCRNVNRFKVGQNVAIKGTSGNSNIPIADLVWPWYNEVEHFDRNAVGRFAGTKGRNGRDVGHYTQVVWAKTTRIGCGLAKYNWSGFRASYLVCNYGPAGNFLGQPLYERR